MRTAVSPFCCLLSGNLTVDQLLAVTAVENGLQAWKILEDLTTHMDLVLAEVVLPSLSGIGLLCKIMGHKTCKNIPVISEFISNTVSSCKSHVILPSHL